ncbi:OXA-1090 family carbapenem-hydrolyzing class D beta-lactamase [uncultured Hyphomonas sp.]|uniref:OXA-1090 family carbapenem-hydrolyzing class D beta-lactamase n=1 Tax=uncultured Hyphomonas sp. TaxID=225298 RepID=UPI002AAADEC4|nr:OXA-1090 family carbapenem-hydrolyzing class D beta-lactamase [uncultured Hyphomonas sp.]
MVRAWLRPLLALSACLLAACVLPASGIPPQNVESSLESAGVDPSRSALLIVRLEDEATWSSGTARLDKRFVAASTSKIPHTLIAIETGAVSGPDEWFEWDGQARFLPAWNKSQTLADAFRHSTVWIYQTITPRIGSEALHGWLASFGYGNADTGAPEDVTAYWLKGPLRISASEQVAFLRCLVRHELPLPARTYDLAVPVMLAEEGEGWRLYAKTGWFSSDEAQDIGWYVGWLERSGGDAPGTYVFAFNMDVITPETDIPRRPAAVRQALVDIGALPAS